MILSHPSLLKVQYSSRSLVVGRHVSYIECRGLPCNDQSSRNELGYQSTCLSDYWVNDDLTVYYWHGIALHVLSTERQIHSRGLKCLHVLFLVHSSRIRSRLWHSTWLLVGALLFLYSGGTLFESLRGCRLFNWAFIVVFLRPFKCRDISITPRWPPNIFPSIMPQFYRSFRQSHHTHPAISFSLFTKIVAHCVELWHILMS
jgi:hypothetical protein